MCNRLISSRAARLPLARASLRADWRFIHEYYTGMCAHMLHTTFGKPLVLNDPASVIVFEDHTSYVTTSPRRT